MTSLRKFEAWPKIPRLSKTMVVTEKIDGTNAAIIIRPLEPHTADVAEHETFVYVAPENGGTPITGDFYAVGAQSRNRLITPQSDNAGFAQWVWSCADALVQGFGPGRHFGEWWGKGIQRGYDQDQKWFSPFNSSRWNTESIEQANLAWLGVRAVPVLRISAVFDTLVVDDAIDDLMVFGSQVALGYMNPEGVVVYHAASGQLFKRLIENDDRPKSVVEAEKVTIAA